ncbi:ABC transporter permease [Labrys sp. KNU-23]|uniref:ABC transporter permease n=1 Tax=Labrys sp. KNU-23 TaxID=2789216 RepID=UPI0011F02CBD|nr:ABC transporter permease [Labrys sp. KNU-23]QEN85697.1 ABC transporter permease [Labrys sp. KNU-23]
MRANPLPPEPAQAVTIIGPDRLWSLTDLRELWRYRELIWVLTQRDVKVRYKQTTLGFAWAIIQPVLLMLVFSVLFGRLAGIPADGSPYPIFVYAGLLPWIFFSNTVSAAAGSLVGSINLVGKVYFPRLIIPLASAGVGLVDFLIATVILLAMMLIYGVGWSANLLAAPLLIAGTILCALGVGIGLSALTVTYRDFRFVVPFLLQFWMFVTPVVYPASLVPEPWRWLLFLNPMAGLVEGFRSAFLGHPFDWPSIGLSLALSLGLVALGVWYFERVERRFADIL